MGDTHLFRYLRKHLSAEDQLALRNLAQAPAPEDYTGLLRQTIKALPALEEQVQRNREKVEGYRDLLELPPSRIDILLENSPPPTLAALAWSLIRQSHEARFSEPSRAVRLAQLALRVATALGRTGYLGKEGQIDLEAEVWIYLANARRVNSEVRAAEKAFRRAWRLLQQGTQDPALRAEFFFLKGAMRFSQGHIGEAASLFDRELQLRRQLGDADRIGQALINRGVVAAWGGSMSEALELLGEGAELVEDEDYLVITLHPLAERLARDGEGLLAWKVVCAAEIAASLLDNTTHQLRLKWIKGITYRSFGELDKARDLLWEVRENLLSSRQSFKAALASLDLASVAAAQGDYKVVRQLAEEAYAIFNTGRLGRRALAAFLLFYRAAERDQLSEELAVRVANFVVSQQHDRGLRFERPVDS